MIAKMLRELADRMDPATKIYVEEHRTELHALLALRAGRTVKLVAPAVAVRLLLKEDATP